MDVEDRTSTMRGPSSPAEHQHSVSKAETNKQRTWRAVQLSEYDTSKLVRVYRTHVTLSCAAGALYVPEVHRTDTASHLTGSLITSSNPYCTRDAL